MAPRRAGAGAFYAGLVGSSFLYLYRRGNGRGTRLSASDSAAPFPRRLQRRSLRSAETAAARRFIPLASLPANRIMSSFVSPLLERRREREREKGRGSRGYTFPVTKEKSFFLLFPPLCRARTRSLPAFSSTAPLSVRGPRKRRLNAARERGETRVG